ncbi:hypothetical protein D9615_003130 [Tricholomella constricta]|uniref:Ubiquitin-like protease family profile domain-containing protein n=1 Tax=Tricholomella constricta TaxID=117010 RepID=A0A8H5M883_9AGAR|nr:hypothetical protein D9615_003130 [Tricholomella constricta]
MIQMSPNTDIVTSDDEDCIGFIEAEWIGVGKKYPRNTPGFIARALNRLLSIPPTFCDKFPLRESPVSMLLSYPIPSQSDEFLFVGALKWFSHKPPSVNPRSLLNQWMPSSHELKQLRKAVGQAWFDGHYSIVNLLDPDSECLPFWCISFWDLLLKIREGQEMLKKAWKWCGKEMEKMRKNGDYDAVDTLEQVKERFGRLAWDAGMDFEKGMVKTLGLSHLLGPEQLTDSDLNMMVQVLTERLPPDSKFVIASLTLTYDILNIDTKMKLAKNKYDRTVLKRYENLVKTKGIQAIFFPLHVDTNHWIVGKIDFQSDTVSYGDSNSSLLFMAVPRKFNRKLLKWLSSAFGRCFTDNGNCLPCATQVDGYSCGLLAINTIGHAVSGVPLWQTKYATQHCVKWFLEFADRALNGSNGTDINIAAEIEALNANSKLLHHLDATVLQGDHNFPNLARMAIANLLNPAPESRPMCATVNPEPETALTALRKLRGTKLKYVPARFRNSLLGELYAKHRNLQGILDEDSKTSPLIKIAQAYLDGRLDDKEVFKGLITAMASQLDREERGVGMQNFQYPPAWEEMCQILREISPQTYEALAKHIRMPTGRSLSIKRARVPRFPMELCDRTFDNVYEQLKLLKYRTGHVALSCDDTKLLPGYCLYWDSKDQVHYLIGGDEGRLMVADPEQVTQVLESTNSKEATKLRLWCLTLPVPRVSPIIVAALPISDKLDADQLFVLLKRVLDGLIDKEWSHTTYQFSLYRSQAICVIQDSKHCLKTLRNNLFSGARLLTFASSVAAYRCIRQLVDGLGRPLPKRDVEKTDSQDDNAACRLFSAGVLEYLIEHHQEESIAEIVYLFVFGELLALGARYFLDTWTAFLEVTEHLKAQHHLSREALDIIQILIKGLLALVVIHRDYIDGLSPLLLWLNSKEPCEHVFGSARKVVKDFTFLDFIYMIPKLQIKLREAALYTKVSMSDPKARASGYNHAYFDHDGVDLIALANFLSDDEIKAIARAAAQEADSLSGLVGINAS